MQPVRVVEGMVTVLDRADVDTDQIIPKQFLKRIERTGFGEFLFYDWVRSGEVNLAPAPILAAGRNFGCGSSREHAVWAILQYGFRAVVAPSLSDIFASNCTKNGLLPVALAESDVRALMTAGRARIDLQTQTASFDGRSVHFDIDAGDRHRLLHGLDEIAMTLAHDDEIAAYEREHAGTPPSG